MEEFFSVVLAVVVAIVYLIALAVFFVYVAVFVVAGVGLYVAGDLLAGYFRRAHGVLTRVPEFELVAPYRPGTSENGPEPAYRQYFFGPAMRDLGQIITHGWQYGSGRAVTYADRFTGWTFTAPPVPVAFTWPVGVAMLTGLGVGTAAGAAGVGAIAFLHATAAVCAQLAARGVIAALRAADTLVLAARGIRGMRCPWCYHKNPYPAYQCGQCQRLHHDIRPGRYGVLGRRCACDARIPTLILLGSYRLNAYCVYCRRQMSDETGRFPEVELPLLGGRAAGKTRLMAAMLLDLASPGGARMRLASAEAQRAYQVLATVLDEHGHILATTGDLPQARAFQLSDGRSTRLIHIFDPAGERLVDRDRADELRYHETARTFVFVLDPLSVTAFWDLLPPPERERLDSAPASLVHPQDVYDVAVQQVLAMGGRLNRARLAVAISKTDLVRHTVPLEGHPDTDVGARAFVAATLGLGNLVRAMDHQFREVRFFFTAAVTVAPRQVDPSVRPLVEWALDIRPLSSRPLPEGCAGRTPTQALDRDMDDEEG